MIPRSVLVCAVFAAATYSPVVVADQTGLDRPIRPGTPSAIPARIKKIMPELYLVTGRGGNSVVRNTSEGPILVDTKVMYNVVWNELETMIAERVSEKPVKLAFVTHHHADHGGNNLAVIDSGAELVGHENIIDILATYKSIIAPVNPANPTITFKDRFERVVGGVPVVAYFWGPAHTNADIAVHFPQDKVVVVGDMMSFGGAVAVDTTDGQGSLLGMRARLDDILELDFQLAISGSGENVMTRDEVELYRDRFDELVERGIRAVERGVAPEGLHEAMLSYDLGFRLVGHFWTEARYMEDVHEELVAEIRRRKNEPAGKR